MLTAPPSNADEAIAALLASPDIAPLIAAHRVLEPRAPRHAPWPNGVDPRLVDALRKLLGESFFSGTVLSAAGEHGLTKLAPDVQTLAAAADAPAEVRVRAIAALAQMQADGLSELLTGLFNDPNDPE